MSLKEKIKKDKKTEGDVSENSSSDNPLQEKVKELEKDLTETKNLLLRTAAEYDNFRKRSEREKASVYADASSMTILNILPLADSLDAALKSLKGESEKYQKGIKLLKNQLDSAFTNLKVETFGNIGDDFDPNIHNAISHKESEEEKQNYISGVYQKGYKMNDRIIRHAMVEVTN